MEIGARPGDGHWTVQVRDTGFGVPPEYQEEVFTPYVRAPNARRGGHPGTGPGPAGVREAVRLHGGTLTVRDRREGPGAVFTVRLPLRDRDPGRTAGGPDHGGGTDGGGGGRTDGGGVP
ncbi:sensor histidine kinase [Streptomyces omiyaensis]|uniref:histidine kinase n=1 Tax=Streptomyces omiyaensis TaxID=68247 RepID=A0ABW7BKD7_9ACTN